MSEEDEKEARESAGLVTKYVAVLAGNLCAISAIYFAVRNEFIMPQTAQVVGIWFMVWLILVILVHMLVRPWLEKRNLRKRALGNVK